ncbi:protein-tyrosine phosphatase-like protein [Collybia nuda]|uniref:protein-tyrosine-phosphatase n=1 Tax=Collybia nuda TaxID=64659 RepID=A0A9P5Y7P9_9AGAR|nr:protein-tyrosine phosphatase-like protein [Collybia nuda]
MTFGLPNLSEILKGQIYIGNLSAARSIEYRKKYGITHTISVCPEYPSTGPNHLAITIEDTEYDDILVHLPKACQFIQRALEEGGKVLVHCVMGISRSATVVAAFLMKTRKLSRSAAVRFIKQRRPQVHPNYGFIKQLEIFAECHYEVSPDNPEYTQWKRQRQRIVTKFLNSMVDTTSIIPDQLLLSSDFPEEVEQAESLLLDLGITHLLSLSPTRISFDILPPSTKHLNINVNDHEQASLLIALPSACKFIKNAIDEGGQVLVHCLTESRACVVVCAYLMSSRNIRADQAYANLEDELPLFNPTRSFSRHLELYELCGRNPTLKHPVVKDWIASEKPRNYIKGPSKRTSLCTTAADVLSETGIDMTAFGNTLTAIQISHA